MADTLHQFRRVFVERLVGEILKKPGHVGRGDTAIQVRELPEQVGRMSDHPKCAGNVTDFSSHRTSPAPLDRVREHLRPPASALLCSTSRRSLASMS